MLKKRVKKANTEAQKHFVLCAQWQNSMHYHANDKTLTSIAPSVESASTLPLWCWRYFHPWSIAFMVPLLFVPHSCSASLPFCWIRTICGLFFKLPVIWPWRWKSRKGDREKNMQRERERERHAMERKRVSRINFFWV